MRMKEAYFRLISGQSQGVGSSVVRAALQALSPAYGLSVRARNAAFDRGWRIHRAAVPVVSIGNITTGGTGKTPFAALVARFYAEHGVRAAFVSRGYRAASGSLNDEALVLKRLCPEVPHVQHADRVRGVARAISEFSSQLVILDDGFQHRRLARDLDIVLVDATNPWGYGHLLPRGLLREPRAALSRAHLVVLTRVDQARPESLQELRRQIATLNPNCGISEVTFPPERLVGACGREKPLEALKSSRVAAFCGIGNPAAFRASLESLGCAVVDFRTFPDHHGYARGDLEDLDRWAKALPAEAVLCTQKDLVKIGRESLGDRPLWALAVGATLIRGADLLTARLTNVLPHRAT
jgi:tetraacyldisaccharide 4'-kinase